MQGASCPVFEISFGQPLFLTLILNLFLILILNLNLNL